MRNEVVGTLSSMMKADQHDRRSSTYELSYVFRFNDDACISPKKVIIPSSGYLRVQVVYDSAGHIAVACNLLKLFANPGVVILHIEVRIVHDFCSGIGCVVRSNK